MVTNLNLFSECEFNDVHRFELSEDEICKIFGDKAYISVIKTTAFQRLKDIHFLGAIDYTIDPKGPKPNKRHTRFQHSLGVGRLALEFARKTGLSIESERTLVISALLHDIGHAPLSHSLETVFEDKFGLNHHITTERIIKGQVSLGKGLDKLLEKMKINPIEIVSIICGHGDWPYRHLFSYSINIDTIEAILRGATYIFKNDIFNKPSAVLSSLITLFEIQSDNEDGNFRALDAESLRILDKFWMLKDTIYTKFINSKTGVLADFLSQKYMNFYLKKFHKDIFYDTETELKVHHAELFKYLELLNDRKALFLFNEVEEIIYINREFHIVAEQQIYHISDLSRRYVQRKTPNKLIWNKSDLLNDYSETRNAGSQQIL